MGVSRVTGSTPPVCWISTGSRCVDASSRSKGFETDYNGPSSSLGSGSVRVKSHCGCYYYGVCLCRL